MDFNALSKRLIVITLLSFLSACADDGGEKDSRVVISATDKITDLNILQYQLPLVVQVADIDGSPQANTEVKINLTTTGFYKGRFTHQDTDTPLDGTTDEWRYENWPTLPPWCQAEDINNNAILDAGEDVNLNGLLEPETPTLTAHPSETPTLIAGTSSLITDSNGFGYLTVTYPKSEAFWVTIRLTATTQGGLSENRDVYEISLPISTSDVEKPENEQPAFRVSPYGLTADCASTD